MHMRRKWGLALGVPGLFAVGLMLIGSNSNAADHLDAPGAEADPAADINDLFVFRSKDPAAGTTPRTVFVMTVFPLADQQSRFSDKVDYEFRIEDAGDPTKKMNITCTADTGTPQKVTCTGPGSLSASTDFDAVVAGDAQNDDIRMFAGLRDDPFFFDLEAFKKVQADPTQVGLLTDATGKDFLAGANVLAIVVDVKNSVFGTSTKLAVHAATTRTGI
jgi:hypothetical protein